MVVFLERKQRLSATDTRNAIESWFLEHKDDNPDKLRQSKTWRVVRKYIDIMGHYKAKGRGKPNYHIGEQNKSKQTHREAKMASGSTKLDYEAFND